MICFYIITQNKVEDDVLKRIACTGCTASNGQKQQNRKFALLPQFERLTIPINVVEIHLEMAEKMLRDVVRKLSGVVRNTADCPGKGIITMIGMCHRHLV